MPGEYGARAAEMYLLDQKLPEHMRPKPVRTETAALRCYRIRPDGTQCGLLIYETISGERFCYGHPEDLPMSRHR